MYHYNVPRWIIAHTRPITNNCPLAYRSQNVRRLVTSQTNDEKFSNVFFFVSILLLGGRQNRIASTQCGPHRVVYPIRPETNLGNFCNKAGGAGSGSNQGGSAGLFGLTAPPSSLFGQESVTNSGLSFLPLDRFGSLGSQFSLS